MLCVAGAIGMYVLLGMAIRRANRRQRPVLWAAVAVSALMILFPPWLGEKGEWVNVSETPGKQDSQYVRSNVPMGYALIMLPPKPRFLNTDKPMGINWRRLALQIGVVAVGAAVAVLARRTKSIAPVSDESLQPAEESV